MAMTPHRFRSTFEGATVGTPKQLAQHLNDCVANGRVGLASIRYWEKKGYVEVKSERAGRKMTITSAKLTKDGRALLS